MNNDNVILLQNTKTLEIEPVEKDDILKVDSDSKGVIFVTRTDIYRFPNTVEFWTDVLYEDGFRMLDRNNTVNMNQVNEVDEVRMEVKFYDTNITASVTQMHKEYTNFILRHKKIGKSLREIDIDFMNEIHGKSVFKKLVSHLGKMLRRTTDNNTVGEKV